MRFISWNIDSINAALTGTSARAEETRAVLEKIKAAAPDVIAIQETKLSKSGPTKSTREFWRSCLPVTRSFGAPRSSRRARGTLGQCTYIRKV